jgi:hypothetical protein
VADDYDIHALDRFYFPMPADPRALRDCMGGSSTVTALLQRADKLSRVEELLHEWLGEPWSSSIRVANIRGDALVVFARSAAALTKLRYSRDDFLALLHHRLGVNCNELIMKVKPTPDE